HPAFGHPLPRERVLFGLIRPSPAGRGCREAAGEGRASREASSDPPRDHYEPLVAAGPDCVEGPAGDQRPGPVAGWREEVRGASGVVSAQPHGFVLRSPCIVRVQARSRRNWPRAALAYRYAALLKLTKLAMASTAPIKRRRRLMSKLHDGNGEEEQQRTDRDHQ